MKPYYVGILGGGASGLGAAVFLQGRKHKVTGQYIQCVVFEKRTYLGGNVYSAYEGERQFVPPFGDMGVNDFNHKTYRTFVELLDRLKAHGYPVAYNNLCDTTTWFTPRGQSPAYCYTYDQMEHPDKHPDKPYLPAIKADWSRFRNTIDKALHDPTVRKMSVDDYAKREGYSAEFINLNLKPRINGMYYMNGRDPGQMPIYGVLKYYRLQENIGDTSGKSTRKYFVDGASSWIEQLREYLVKLGTDFVTGVRAQAAPTGDGAWVVGNRQGKGQIFDAVISTVGADEMLMAIPEGLPAEVADIAGRFEYLPSHTYLHTDETVLPEDKAEWTTYNITIYPEKVTGPRPYTISYVSAMHQGRDEAVPPIVSVDPVGGLDEAKVLQMIDPGEPSERRPAKVPLRHNTLTVAAIEGQEALQAYQGKGNLYYSGGWTVGAGLHEEILGQSHHIAEAIRGADFDHLIEVHKPDDPTYVPRHLRGHSHDGPSERLHLPEDMPLMQAP